MCRVFFVVASGISTNNIKAFFWVVMANVLRFDILEYNNPIICAVYYFKMDSPIYEFLITDC